jgi:hypothetical protein
VVSVFKVWGESACSCGGELASVTVESACSELASVTVCGGIVSVVQGQPLHPSFPATTDTVETVGQPHHAAVDQAVPTDRPCPQSFTAL